MQATEKKCFMDGPDVDRKLIESIILDKQAESRANHDEHVRKIYQSVFDAYRKFLETADVREDGKKEVRLFKYQLITVYMPEEAKKLIEGLGLQIYGFEVRGNVEF